MSRYTVKPGEWVTPDETTGSIQNTSTGGVTIEVTSEGVENGGLTLSSMQIINFDGTIHVRGTGRKDATFTVVPFKISAGGGGGGGTPYTLPTASKTVKGGIKVGTGLFINNQVLEALPNYTNNVSYVVGDKVVYNNAIYYCKTAHTSTSTFNPTNWQLLGSSGTSIDFWTSGTQYSVNDLVIKDDKIYYCKVANQDTSWTESKWQLLGKVCITDWASNTQYVAKDLVIYDKKIYQAKSNHTSGTTFNENNWDLISGCEDQLVDWTSNTQYKVKDFVVYDKKIYRCKTAHTSGTTFVDTNWDLISGCEDQITDWTANTQYAVKDIVINNNTIYRCKTAHTSGTTFSDTNWDKLSGEGGSSITKWATNTNYKVGNIVILNGSLFYCLTAHTSSTFSSDSANWELIYSDMKLWSPSTYYTVGVTVINNKKVYRCKTAHTSGTTFNSTEEANWELIYGGGTTIEDWASSTGYVVGDIVISNNNLYKCKTAHTSGSTFDATEEANWNLISSGSDEHILLDWKQSTKYEVNEIAYYNGSVFRCNTAHTSGTTGLASDIANWTLITSDIKVWNPSTSYIAGVVVIQGNKLYKCKTTHVSATSFNTTEKANWDEIVGGSGVSIEDCAAGGTYAVDDLVIYNDFIYKCTTANSDSNFTPSNWRKLGGITNWQASKSYLVGDVVINDKKLYRCKTQHTSGSTFSDTNWDLLGGSSIDTWQASTAYNVGDLVIESNVLYQCKTAHTSGSIFSDTNWNKIDGGITIQPYEDTPIGTVISYMGTTAPEEYLACDGTVYNINDYWELADFINVQFGSKNFFGGDGTITFAVPDLRGEFLRGAGTNSHANNGNGASVGVHQDGTQYNNVFGDGVGSVVMPGTGADTSNDRLNGNNYNIDKYITKYGAPKLRYTGFNNATASDMNSHYTSRPTNTSVLYCIKYTNAPSMQPSNIYSTTEKRIGTWIDGKPLYQITYSTTTPSTLNTSTELVSLPTGVTTANVIELKYMFYTIYNDAMPTSYYYDSNSRCTVWIRSNGKITCTVSSSNYSNTNMYITIKYTKTTD